MVENYLVSVPSEFVFSKVRLISIKLYSLMVFYYRQCIFPLTFLVAKKKTTQ